MPLDQAALYEAPFEYVKENVMPVRVKNKTPWRAENWWLHGYPAAAMRQALNPLPRYIGTSVTGKHRLFSWLAGDALPSNLVVAIARDDDYTFGVLHSRVHEVWALNMGTQLETRPRYTPTTCFETFPFPQPSETQRQDIAEAAKDLNKHREGWLNPPGLPAQELKKRTLTNLYNTRPTWLQQAHQRLDQAVLDAYAWPEDLTEPEILERLLALNLERAEKEQASS